MLHLQDKLSPVFGVNEIRTPRLRSQVSGRFSTRYYEEAHAYHKIEEDARPVGIIYPEETWKQRWDLLMLLFILYSAAVVPFRVSFGVPATGVTWVFEAAMSLAFMVDVSLCFRTAFFRDGELVTSEGEISHRYLNGWFWVDAPSSVPTELIELAFDTHTSSGWSLLRVLRLLRLMRLLKLLNIYDAYVEKLEEHLEASVNVRLAEALYKLLILAFLGHTLGCFFFGVGMLSRRCDVDGACTPTWFSEYGGLTFAEEIDEAETSISQLYLWSIYWSVMTLTTTGYGDIVPTNDTERAYMIFMMGVSALTFAYMVSEVSRLLSSLDRHESEVGEKIASVKQYVQSRGIPLGLAKRIKRHYKYLFTHRAPFDEMELLNGCPPTLRSDTIRFLLKKSLGKMPLFENVVDPEFQSELFPVVQPVSFSAGELIFYKGEVSRELLFLLEGEVDVLSVLDSAVVDRRLTPREEIFLAAAARNDAQRPPGSPPELPPAIWHSGCFGQSVFTGQRRPQTHVAKTAVRALVASRTDLEAIFQRNPRPARHIFACVMAETIRKERLHSLAMRLLISVIPHGRPMWAALFIQLAWHRHAKRLFQMSIFEGLEGSLASSSLRKHHGNSAMDVLEGTHLRRSAEAPGPTLPEEAAMPMRLSRNSPTPTRLSGTFPAHASAADADELLRQRQQMQEVTRSEIRAELERFRGVLVEEVVAKIVEQLDVKLSVPKVVTRTVISGGTDGREQLREVTEQEVAMAWLVDREVELTI